MFSHLERLHDTGETPAGTTLHYWWIYAAPETGFSVFHGPAPAVGVDLECNDGDDLTVV